MEWQIVIALVIAVPVILFPAAFVWYLNLGELIRSICCRLNQPAESKIGGLKVSGY